ncbi:MAG: manganese efflux pump [Clostridiales bacterium]|nr:manganese efflux pump [Clostridiales bacterium]
MGFAELFILAVGLSMDAFAVAICKGLSIRALMPRHAVIVGLWFGAFQALMPLIGWLLGAAFTDMIAAVDHWIAFVLLALIGGNMIREAVGKDEDECDPSLAPLAMLVLAVATSIDALAVGVTFAFLRVDIVPAVTLIGVCTFVISAAGVKIGNVFGARYKSKAELLGGAVLVLIGLKILLEHLELLPF